MRCSFILLSIVLGCSNRAKPVSAPDCPPTNKEGTTGPRAKQRPYWAEKKHRTAKDLCGIRTIYGGTVFSLYIRRSFHPPVQFHLCGREKSEPSFLLVAAGRKTLRKLGSPKRIDLTPTQYERLVALYEEALGYDVKDDMGAVADGSSWCLETEWSTTYSKACFWSPEVDADTRRLKGLFNLGRELWKIAEVQPKLGPLY